jgi:4-hydroxythreonine-4-phosphate dehydrogenase
MIHITQGHERSISIEVLLKSLLLIHPRQTHNKIVLHANPQALADNAHLLNLHIDLRNNSVEFHNHSIQLHPIPNSTIPQSTEALLSALKAIKKDDILVTLPTTKDQLVLNNHNPLGHTEFFRQYYNLPNLPMFFYSKNLKILLLSDHISLKEVSGYLKSSSIIDKVQLCLDGYKKFFGKLDEVIFTGINPHAGEGGLLGHEESELKEAILKLTKTNHGMSFIGPIPGDTAHTKLAPNKLQIIIYSFHDQGLPFFKATQNFFGINTTFGLPFLRLSPDHGTALELWGKNEANPLGLHDVLLKALSIG